MIRDEDFAIRVLSDEAGLRIEATHRPTREVRTSIVGAGVVGEVRDRLVEAWKREFYDPAEFEIAHLRTAAGETICVTHLPSGKRRGAKREPGTHDRATQFVLIDELVRELVSERL